MGNRSEGACNGLLPLRTMEPKLIQEENRNMQGKVRRGKRIGL